MRWCAVVLCCGLVILGLGSTVWSADCGDGVECRCGDVVRGRARLAADLGPCAADGLTLREGALLDCDGHTIRGVLPPPGVAGRAPETLGIVLDRTVGAVVRNCTVTGFRTGIMLREARRSTVMGCHAIRNGDMRSRVGYGIHLARSQENTIIDCTVRESADEGIHVGGGSDDNALLNIEAYDNGRENFYVLSARGTHVRGSRAGGKVSANLYLKHATGSRVEENHFTERPVVVRGRSVDNVFSANVFAGGLSFRAYPDWGPGAVGPERNVVRGGALSGTGRCLEFADATDNEIDGVRLDGCGKISARSEKMTSNRIIGVPLEGVPLDLAGGATLRLLASLAVATVDETGAPVPDARIEVRGPHGDPATTATTDKQGLASLRVQTHLLTPAHLMATTPVTLRVAARGYGERETELPTVLPAQITITLPPTG